jgi:lysophospholipase L1-like esterase
VVLLGDSLTQWSFSDEGRWGAMIAARLQRTCDVVNRGFGAYTSGHVSGLLPSIFHTFGEPVAAITIFLGTNDAHRWIGVNPPETYAQNLKDIVNYLEVWSTVGIT